MTGKEAHVSHRLKNENLYLVFENYCPVSNRTIKVKSDILLNMNKQHVTVQVLLDLSVAFGTVNQTVQQPHKCIASFTR